MKNLMNLANLKEGNEGKIADIAAGWKAAKRLSDLGLTPGTEIKVLKKGLFLGPVEIECRGAKLAIGRGLCRKIFITKDESKK